MTDDTLDAMARYGGSFVKQLAELTRAADPINRQKLMAAFPEYFAEYKKIAEETRGVGSIKTRAEIHKETGDD
jgi:hypothetical protein